MYNEIKTQIRSYNIVYYSLIDNQSSKQDHFVKIPGEGEIVSNLQERDAAGACWWSCPDEFDGVAWHVTNKRMNDGTDEVRHCRIVAWQCKHGKLVGTHSV